MRTSKRRGMLLLLVLALLAMFSMAAITFVIMSGAEKSTALNVASNQQVVISPGSDTDYAMKMLLTGPPASNTVCPFGPGLLENVFGRNIYSGSGGFQAVLNGQLLEVTVPNPAQKVGCNITMTSGVDVGLSSRIVGVTSGNSPQALVLAFPGGTVPGGDSYIINGFPYSGAGFGYNSATGACDAVDQATGMPLALLENNPVNRNPPGGANPDYTAPDFQNWYLGFAIPSGQVPIPSFQRSDVLAYINAKMNGQLLSNANVSLLRQVLLRPNSIDHPNFTGGNPNFNPLWDGVTAGGGRWDVDNMGTGTPDSVWLDIGMQVRYRADGKAYKPLVAYLVLDMDGRLNVNAHGNSVQTMAAYNQPVNAANGVTFAGGANNFSLLHGQGTGGAEVNLNQMLPLQSLISGGGQYPGRYGTDGMPGTNIQNSPSSLLNWNREFPYNQNYGAAQAAWDAYGSPPDLGYGAMGLDNAGRMLYFGMGGSQQNSPYDVDFSPNAPAGVEPYAADCPYSAAELEAVLRMNDPDASMLPQRLASLGVGGSRTQITTASFSFPTIPGLLPLGIRGTALSSILGASNLPWETQQGLKMNIDRPFGAGARSKNGVMANGATQTVPDQPGLTKETVSQYVNGTLGFKDIAFAYDPTGQVTDSLAARQLYAQNLYTLMNLVCDTKAIATRLGSAAAAQRYIAQWAVNCVAYRDHNEIMIPFNYGNDGSAANTVWGCKRPALLITEDVAVHDRRTQDLNDEVVDKAKPGASAQRVNPGYTQNKGNADPKSIDPSFNSKKRPQGSLFIELYNPGLPKSATYTEPLTTDLAPSNGAGGVELTKVTPAVGGQSSPVWRIIIVDPTKNPAANGGLPDPDNSANGAFTIERSAYFVPLTNMAVPTDSQVAYYVSQANARSIVVPAGGYAVVGSGDANESNRTYLGFENGQTAGQSGTSRMITLNPGDLNVNSRVVQNTSDPAVQVPAPQVLGIDAPQRLSVSEPVKGYVPFELDGNGAAPGLGAAADGSTIYTSTLDIPPDQRREMMGENGVWSNIINVNGTTPAYRIIYLQRLADPTRPYAAAGNGAVGNWNPYLTIDAMTVDLTCFNGVTADTDPTTKTGAYPKTSTGVTCFKSHQRGETNYLENNSGSNTEMNLWKQELPTSNYSPVSSGVPNSQNEYFAMPLAQSLGILNTTYGSPANPAGDPQYPFPGLYFAYRPFINEYELFQVPTASSSQLLANNGTRGSGYGYMDQWARAQVAGGTASPYQGATFSNYPHLLNFFDSAPVSSQGQPVTGVSPQFHRILGYVGVPSPYAHMQVLARPDQAAALPANIPFHTPYNGIPSYREPGRINVNTIASQGVFQGWMNGDKALAGLWNNFVASRRGDKNTDLSINPQLPSRWSRPFRTSGGAGLSYQIPGDNEIDATLLRPDPATPGRPLFDHDDPAYNTPVQPGGQTPDAFTNAPVDYNRNSYFRYQGLQRVGATATTQSNVFAVWVTVGYFEAIPVSGGPSATYPDGFQLGQELGTDTGDITRHKAFYIYDRSLPVGFMPGQDVNSDVGFMLKRTVQ